MLVFSIFYTKTFQALHNLCNLFLLPLSNNIMSNHIQVTLTVNHKGLLIYELCSKFSLVLHNLQYISELNQMNFLCARGPKFHYNCTAFDHK